MAGQIFKVSGRLLDRQTGASLEGLRVEAWDSDLLYDDLVGSAITGSEGRFQFEFDETYFAEIFEGREPELFFRVYEQNDLLADPVEPIRWRLDSGETEIRLEIDRPARAVAGNSLLVQGQVVYQDGREPGIVTVRAYNRQLRRESLLGQTTNAEDGSFKIYTETTADSGRPNLVVKAFGPADILLGSSAVVFKAAPGARIKVILDGSAQPMTGPTEIEGVSARLYPNLSELHPAQLTEADLAFLTVQIGLPAEQVAGFSAGARLGQLTRLPPEIFYGLFRLGLPASLPGLLAKGAGEIKAALETAVRRNLIPARFRAEFNNVIPRLQDAAIEQFLNTREQTLSLGELLSTTGLNPGDQKRLLRMYLDHQGPIEDFWKGVREDPRLGNGVGEVQFSLQAATLTQNNLPLVRELQKLRQAGSLKGWPDLAHWDDEQWQKLVQATGQLPPGLPGKTTQEQSHQYIERMKAIIELAFPTAALAARLEKDDLPGKQDLLLFFGKNPGFELGQTHIDRYIEEKGEAALAGVNSRPELVQNLKRLQRLFKITPHYPEMKVLQAAGFDSALDMVRLGKEGFNSLLAGKLGGLNRSNAIYASARQTSARALAVSSRYDESYNNNYLYVTPRQTAQVDKTVAGSVPDLETLFGAISWCECEECRSVYSPAAYLVDLFSFLRNMVAAGGRSNPLKVLFDRRPDLRFLELSCQNTNVPLPYIDLVNEVLEQAVAPLSSEERWHLIHPQPARPRLGRQPLSDNPNDFWFQTRDPAEQLKAQPAYLNSKAYDRLAGANYPWTMPFDLWLSLSRLYLENLGAPRHQLMRLFREEEFSGGPSALAVATEYLGLSNHESQLITQPSARPWEYWGLNDTVLVTEPVRLKGANSLIYSVRQRDQTVQKAWVAYLSQVSNLLKKSGLSYAELLDLLETDYLNPGRQIERELPADLTCNPEETSLTHLNATTLARLPRFVRLQRALGWTAEELDQTIKAFAPTDLNAAFLVQVSWVKRLRDELNLPLPELLSWWAAIPTTGRPLNPEDTEASGLADTSLYTRLFLNKAILNPPDPAFRLNPDRTELATTGAPLSQHLPALLAGLGLRATDFDLLVNPQTARDLLNLPPEIGQPDLNLATLSHLYRVGSISRSLAIPVADFLALKALSGLDPFDPAHPEKTYEFVELVRQVQDYGFTQAELNYLLRSVSSLIAGPAPDEIRSAQALDEIRKNLQKIQAETTPSPDPTGEVTRRNLAQLLAGPLVDQAILLLESDPTEDQANKAAFIDTQLAAFLDPAEAKARLVGTAALPAKEDRFAYLLEKTLLFLRQAQSESSVKQKIAEALSLESATAGRLLSGLIHSPSNPAGPILADFLEQAFINSQDELIETAYSRQFSAFKLLDKVAMLVNRLNLRAEELPWLFQKGKTLGLLNLNNLPLTPGASAADWQGLFKSWQRLAALYALFSKRPGLRLRLSSVRRAGLPQASAPTSTEQPALFDLFDLVEAFQPSTGPVDELRENLFQFLSELAGWSLTDLRFLAGPSGLNQILASNNPAGSGQEKLFAFLDWLQKLAEVMAFLRRLGVAAGQVFSWAAPEITAPEAMEIKQAVKARYDNDQWLAIAQSLNDQLREQQRDALVSYLLTHPELVGNLNGGVVKDANDLFGRYLLDVETNSCMLTSRLKQAISSVQLFVQRSLLNLELGINLSPEDTEQWQWMKNYRVWEANRKIFLYPENWIEPDLRDDKTSFFQELENELRQQDVTGQIVEDAYRRYLEKLNQVARLQICGVYFQSQDQLEDDGKGIVALLHVFGRSQGQPQLYFYRQRVYTQHGNYWTPWEKVEVDIEGNHLLPVVFNRRLQIYWPIFKRKTEETQVDQNEKKPPQRYYELQFVRSEYANGKWTPKAIFDPVFIITPSDLLKTFGSDADPDQYRLDRPEKFSFRTRITADNELIIRSYVFWFPFRDYRLTGCDGELLEEGASSNRYRIIEPGSSIVNQNFVEVGGANRPIDASLDLIADDSNPSAWKVALKKTPGLFKLYFPSQEETLLSDSPFFYEDFNRTFFVYPEIVTEYIQEQFKPDKPDLTVNPADLYQGLGGIPDRVGPVSGQIGPQVIGPERVLAGTASPLEPGSASPGPLTFSSEGPTLDNSTSVTGPAIPAFATTRIARVASLESLNLQPRVGTVIYRKQQTRLYRFESFYHPYVCEFIKQLNRLGLKGLLNPDPNDLDPQAVALRRQLIKDETYFEADYQPNPDQVARPYPEDEVDFEPSGAYSQYNWELFFHAPLMIATRLTQNLQFKEAQDWFHYIFDPTEVDDHSNYTPQLPGQPLRVDQAGPGRFWKIRPFYENARGKSIQDLLLLLGYSGHDPELQKARQDFEDQIDRWRLDPFNPHLIARLRISAYQKTTVMKYLDTLIAWGDQLFSQDTIETINEATQYYILAAQILGDRPEDVPGGDSPAVRSFDDLEPFLDKFSNSLVSIENALPPAGPAPKGIIKAERAALAMAPTIYLGVKAPTKFIRRDESGGSDQALYFCIPRNDHLLGYWDTVADRLFKIRNCLNIEGVARELPLFEPPIDPALLVRAAAAGVDIGSALREINVSVPFYRFNLMLQKAYELCADVKTLGVALLAALEKRDAEGLAYLRSDQEQKVLRAVREIRKQQIIEATHNLEALEKAADLAEIRYNYFIHRPFMNPAEFTHLYLLGSSALIQAVGQILEIGAAGAAVAPNFISGVAGWAATPVALLQEGGTNVSEGLQSFTRSLNILASILNTAGTMSSVIGGYQRRADEWKHQAALAHKEKEQVGRQILAARIRLDNAGRDLKTQELQIENAVAMDHYLHDKFTNQDLYDWMISQISSVYFQSYQLAYEAAKRAERCFQFERGTPTANFVQFGYWDSLKKGLLAGEKLQYDLRRMEVAYLERNSREYEITRYISLVLHDPIALIALKTTGRCRVMLPEALFDLDYPGHYLRRIKNVSLTIPCVTGPYTSINCTLTLLSSKIRLDSNAQGDYTDQSDSRRFLASYRPAQSIVTSQAQNDSGLFELNFKDERYLPFEGAGVISEWRIELPVETNAFDLDSITDVVMKLSYTSREGGELLRKVALEAATLPAPSRQDVSNPGPDLPNQPELLRLVSARHEFPNEWQRFLQGTGPEAFQALAFELTPERFPYQYRGKKFSISRVDLFLQVNNQQVYSETTPLKVQLLPPDQPDGESMELRSNSGDNNGLPHAIFDFSSQPGKLGQWTLQIKEEDISNLDSSWWNELNLNGTPHFRLKPARLEDLMLVLHYSVKKP